MKPSIRKIITRILRKMWLFPEHETFVNKNKNKRSKLSREEELLLDAHLRLLVRSVITYMGIWVMENTIPNQFKLTIEIIWVGIYFITWFMIEAYSK